MKNTVQKTISVLLLAVLLLTALPLPAAVGASGSTVPIVYLPGQGEALYDANGKKIYDLTIPDGYIDDAVEACAPILLRAITTGRWEEYAAALTEKVAPIFAPIQLDANGEASDGSHIAWSWSRSSLRDTKRNGVYGLQDYMFRYDWRLDPCYTAELLNRYINDVLYVTGASKVNLVGRCEGACVVMAYFARYGYGKINDYVLYSQAVSGVTTASGAFSGKVELNSAAIDRYSSANLSLEDKMLNDLLHSTLQVAADTYGLSLVTGAFNSIYQKAYKTVLPPLLLATYGTFPGIWSMVTTEDYPTARALVFTGRETEYAGLLQKLDRYYSTVNAKVAFLLEKAVAAGVDVANITKYGFQAAPLFYTNEEISDGTALLSKSSLGATCSSVTGRLSASYLDGRRALGYSKHLSADGQVDASTCLLPSKTWIIKGLGHRAFPPCVDSLITLFFRWDGKMSITTYGEYPQFMVYDAASSTLSPMTQDNMGDVGWEENRSFFTSLYRFFRSILQYFRRLFSVVVGDII